MLGAAGTDIGVAQVMTFAIPLGVFGGVVIWGMLSGRSGHDRRSPIRREEAEAEAREGATVSASGVGPPAGGPAE